MDVITMRRNLFGTLVCAFVLTQPFVQERDWSEAKNKNGITVYTRQATGSKFKEFKAETVFETTLHALVAVLMDSPGYTKWYADCGGSKTLKQVNEKELYRHMLVSAPWPVQNRDLVTRVVASQNLQTRVVTIDLFNDKNYIPASEDAIRIPESRGFWKLIPKENKVEVEYQYMGDPGGSLPGWAVNLFIVDGPYRSLMALREVVREDKYQSQVVGWLAK